GGVATVGWGAGGGGAGGGGAAIRATGVALAKTPAVERGVPVVGFPLDKLGNNSPPAGKPAPGEESK
ncbi:MAG: hypothetical protein ACD_28C00169G0001, partial [uncultured bacterium]